MYKIRKNHRFTERNILLACIVSTKYLQEFIPIYKKSYIVNPLIRNLIEEILSYFEKYEQAPGDQIESLISFKMDEFDDEDRDILFSVLNQVDQDHQRIEKFNYLYYLDKTIEYFRKRNIELITEKAEFLKRKGRVEEAESLLSSIDSITGTITTSVDPFESNVIKRTLLTLDHEDLFKLPKEVGNFIGGFQRGWLVAFLAPPKIGKTQWLIESALSAVIDGCNVLLVSLEMTQQDILKRIYQRMLGRPLNLTETVRVLVPKLQCKISVNCIHRSRGKRCSTSCKYYHPMVVKKEEQFNAIRTRSYHRKLTRMNMYLRRKLRVLALPAFTATIQDIENELKILHHKHNFVPDVIVIDYADILKPETDRNQERHNLDRIWKGLKGQASRRHCVVVTASQSNRSSIEKVKIGQMDISEDIRKVAHVDCLIGLQQTSEDKNNMIKRISVVAHRHRYFNPNKQLKVVECPEIGQSFLGLYESGREGIVGSGDAGKETEGVETEGVENQEKNIKKSKKILD